MTTSSQKVLGRIEMAGLLEVDVRTPHAWMSRGLLPTPDYPAVNGSPAWERDTIIEWAIKVGRCPEKLRQEWDPEGRLYSPPHRGGRSQKKAYRND